MGRESHCSLPALPLNPRTRTRLLRVEHMLFCLEAAQKGAHIIILLNSVTTEDSEHFLRTFFQQSFMNSALPLGVGASQLSPGTVGAIESVLTSHRPPHKSGLQSMYKSTKSIKLWKSTAWLKTQGHWGYLLHICPQPHFPPASTHVPDALPAPVWALQWLCASSPLKQSLGTPTRASLGSQP